MAISLPFPARHQVPYLSHQYHSLLVVVGHDPLRRDTGERAPDRPHGSGPFGIKIYLPNGPW